MTFFFDHDVPEDTAFASIVLVRRARRALERAALVQLIERVGEAGLRAAIHFA